MLSTKIVELRDKEWLYQKYITEKMTMIEIAKLLNCGETVIHKWIHLHEIQPHSRSERLMGIKRSEETKKKLSEIHTGKWSGKNNPKYKDGKYLKRQKQRNSRAYINWRKSFIKSKDFTCELCGMDVGVMHLHHVIPIYKGGNIIDNDNAMCLCMTCHRLIHSMNGLVCTF